MPRLLVSAAPAAHGRLHDITPESAGWTYVGFATQRLHAGEMAEIALPGRELCIVALSGRIRVKSGDFESGGLGERADVFSGLPWSVYLPPGAPAEIAAETDAEIAICSAPATGKFRPRVIPPDAVETLTRGKGTNLRHVRNILSETAEAESLLVVEVITPSRPLVELSAAQARPGRPAERVTAWRRPTIIGSTRRRATRCSVSTPTTARSTRP